MSIINQLKSQSKTVLAAVAISAATLGFAGELAFRKAQQEFQHKIRQVWCKIILQQRMDKELPKVCHQVKEVLAKACHLVKVPPLMMQQVVQHNQILPQMR